jgi:Flp pilus assembly protein TadD
MTDETALPSPEELKEFIATAEVAATEALQKGEEESAAKLFNEILSITPSSAVAHNGIGLIAVQNNQSSIAEHHFRKAVEHAPDWPDAHVNLGLLFLHGGRARRAVKMFKRVLELTPDDTAVRYLLAQTYLTQGKRAEQEKELRQIIADDPEHAAASNDLGVIEVQSKNFDDAIEFFKKAADAKEPITGARINMGSIQLITDQNEAAEETFDQALLEQPNSIDALIGKATAQRRNGDLDGALLTAERAASLAPENGSARNAVGMIYRELGIFDAAKNNFSEAIELSPDDPAPRSNLALLNLLHGQWSKAWPDYEARVQLPNFEMSWGMPAVPKWEGQDLSGQAIVVLSEQGFGDSIHYARFLPLLAEKAGDTLFAVQPELAPLMRSLSPNVSIIEPNQPLPDIHFYSLLLSLPGHLGITGPEDIDGSAYLTAPELPKALSKLLSKLDGLKVGINWRGAPRHSEDFKRSIDLEAISPLLDVDGVSFVSLDFSDSGQKKPENITDFSSHISDFGDSAALVNALDLVISVDTSTVHLAGALGTDCWAMIPFVPDWRWQLEGDTTPWYDSVKLFRQPERNDWAGVIERIKSALEKAANA